ncbi:hypothetical protein FG386_001484 [Cryptosporidium ryanae]|uniref:uncharacterized protein n=1 Tax=Cryptosporidium ryanae TaxID=515981 RepID=UPI00351A11F5|nr:hypothetical protein FG386_001484 [Cryptosporidium ryanae]
MEENDFKIRNSYIVEKLISSGSYGTIELVREGLSGKYYILKTANKLELESIIQKEELILKEVKSKYIISYINSYTNCLGFKTLILEYLPRDLRDIIENLKNEEFLSDSDVIKNENTPYFTQSFFYIDINIIIKILFHIISGIHYIHSKSISHNDLKPENILIDDDYNAKICDFGSSFKIVDENQEFREVIPTSISYKSPERLLGTKNQADLLSSDIWSFGCIAFELLTGRKIYDGNSELEQLINVLKIVGTPIKNKSNNYELDEYFCSLPSILESGIMIPIYSENWNIIDKYKHNKEYECIKKNNCR